MIHIDSKLAPARLAQGDIDAVANPASLSMQYYRPPLMQPGAPLVVLLHGCRQHPARYAADSGWLTLAQRHGFALLLPGQVGRNNSMGCFSWFDPAAVAPQGGEAASILAMIDAMITQHGIDRRQVFISGLSAGAMAVALLAVAPGVFAGGGIIAGLPFGAAGSVSDALRAMRDPGPAGGPAWGDKVRAAAPAPARPPPVSIWHGTTDRTVAAGNAEALEAQWADVQGLDPTRMVIQPFGARACRLWHDEAGGRVRLRRWTIAGLGHGTPISPNAPEPDRRLGAVSRFMLESEIGSTWLMARDWGLLASPPTGQAATVQATLRAAGLRPWRP
ncbi:MAG: PHB depolymerase family esterase [Rubritepida sp.]|nr:PHB depolymerase family esterase [Rubritepida sp.]